MMVDITSLRIKRVEEKVHMRSNYFVLKACIQLTEGETKPNLPKFNEYVM